MHEPVEIWQVFKGARLKLPCVWCYPFYVLLLRKTIRVQFYHKCVQILKQVVAGERKCKHKLETPKNKLQNNF
jgi:hypothetical protein